MNQPLAFNFETVRCLCDDCGWFRIIGFSGRYDGKRALIRMRTDSSDCNLVKVDMILGPEEILDQSCLAGLIDFHDVREEAHQMGLYRAQQQYDHLFDGRRCPRCKQSGTVHLSFVHYTSTDFNLHKSWKLRNVSA